MGEVFAGPGFRICSHAGCRWPANATLGFDYGTRRVWLQELTPTAQPAMYDLCGVHSERFKPPLGWHVEDRRKIPEPLFRVDDDVQTRAIPTILPAVTPRPEIDAEVPVKRHQQAGFPDI